MHDGADGHRRDRGRGGDTNSRPHVMMMPVIMTVDIDIDVTVYVDVAVDVDMADIAVDVDIALVAVDVGACRVADLPRLTVVRQSPARRHDNQEGHEHGHAFANDAGIHAHSPLHVLPWQFHCHLRQMTACVQAALME